MLLNSSSFVTSNINATFNSNNSSVPCGTSINSPNSSSSLPTNEDLNNDGSKVLVDADNSCLNYSKKLIDLNNDYSKNNNNGSFHSMTSLNSNVNNEDYDLFCINMLLSQDSAVIQILLEYCLPNEKEKVRIYILQFLKDIYLSFMLILYFLNSF